jgi:hypothetical protein
MAGRELLDAVIVFAEMSLGIAIDRVLRSTGRRPAASV